MEADIGGGRLVYPLIRDLGSRDCIVAAGLRRPIVSRGKMMGISSKDLVSIFLLGQLVEALVLCLFFSWFLRLCSSSGLISI